MIRSLPALPLQGYPDVRLLLQKLNDLDLPFVAYDNIYVKEPHQQEASCDQLLYFVEGDPSLLSHYATGLLTYLDQAVLSG